MNQITNKVRSKMSFSDFMYFGLSTVQFYYHYAVEDSESNTYHPARNSTRR